jgi:hypothetical protein
VLFVINPSDSPSGAWKQVLDRINDMKKTRIAVSGPEQFGYFFVTGICFFFLEILEVL